MPDTPYSVPAQQQSPALLHDVSALLSGWDPSRPATDLIAAINERLESEPTMFETAGSAKVGKKKRGKCMSRRSGQDGSKPYIEGGWWKFRLWVDVPGQEKRRHLAIKICPVEGSGALNASQREARKRELIAEYTGKNKEVVQSQGAVTFAEQGEIMMEAMRTRRRKPAAESTLDGYRLELDQRLYPILGQYPLGQIYSPELKLVATKMSEQEYGDSTIRKTLVIAKQVVKSARDPRTGEPLYPRTWSAEIIDAPIVDPDEQNTPYFPREILTGLAAYKEPRMRMLFILAGATGPRAAELLGLEIGKHITPDFRTIKIEQQAKVGKVIKRVKRPASRREVDLHPDIAAVLKDFVGDRKTGFLFTTRNNTPISYPYVLKHLHSALKALGYTNDMATSGLAGTHAFRRSRDTYLSNDTGCPSGIIKFWLGHAFGKDMSELYNKIKRDRKKRLEWAERCGYDFDLPPAVLLYREQADEEAA